MRVFGQAVVGVLTDPMIPFAALPDRVHMDGHAAEVGKVVEQLVADLAGNIVALDDGKADRKSTRLNSSHIQKSRMPSSA